MTACGEGWGLRLVRWGAAAAFAAYVLVVLFRMATEPEDFQFSFRLYYTAAEAFAEGLDPYDTKVLSKLAGRAMVQPYVYSPITLHLLRPLTWLDYMTSFRLFLLVKAMALAALIWLWHAKFLKSGPDLLFLLICLVGFNYAIYWDLSAGNISLFEQVALWLGFLAFVRGRLGTAAVLIAIAASLKLTPIFFLSLLLFSTDRRRWLWVAVGSLVFVSVTGVSWLIYPDLATAYAANISDVVTHVDAETAGMYQYPATWPLIKALAGSYSAKTGTDLPGLLPVLVYGVVAVAVCGISFFAMSRGSARTGEERAIQIVMLACLVYVLITPRLMYYSYIIAILPSYYAARRIGQVPAAMSLLALAAISTHEGRPPVFRFLVECAVPYYPLLLTYLVWMAYCWYACTERTSDAPLA